MRTREEILKDGIEIEIESEIESLSKAFSECLDPRDMNHSPRCSEFNRRLKNLVNFARRAGPPNPAAGR